eukprot:TRINITY_DN7302_c0_g1_i1.p1 TRINITY_DN7302_c0_g1~~TRINITY_DN7302_c0_g1_i1.p1  ORF type:complete len:384 (+),score=67.67 TRINITY_DN7302_c0_g1_i1:40-1152(+)
MSNASQLLGDLLSMYRRMAGVIETRTFYREHAQEVVDELFQASVYEKVLNDPVCLRYPPSIRYRHSFLKTYIAHIEEEYAAVDDQLLTYFLSNLHLKGKVSESEGAIREVCHSSYDVNERVGLVTIKMATQLDSVGLTSWEAGFFLAEYFIAEPDVLRGKKVVELGAGIGLTGIALAKGVDLAHITLTDYTTDVMQNLQTNVDINKVSSDLVSVQTLDWEQPFSLNADFDCIIVADCVYDPELTVAMVKVISELFNLALAQNPRNSPFAIVATTKRQPQTFQHFLAQLEERELSHYLLNGEKGFVGPRLFHYPPAEFYLSRIELSRANSLQSLKMSSLDSTRFEKGKILQAGSERALGQRIPSLHSANND